MEFKVIANKYKFLFGEFRVRTPSGAFFLWISAFFPTSGEGRRQTQKAGSPCKDPAPEHSIRVASEGDTDAQTEVVEVVDPVD